MPAPGQRRAAPGSAAAAELRKLLSDAGSHVFESNDCNPHRQAAYRAAITAGFRRTRR